MRAFGRVDENGKITVPGNVFRAAGLKKGGLVELRIAGASRKKSIVVTARENAR